MITFHGVEHYSQIVEETELYQLHHNSEALFMYDYNFIQFKRSPTLGEFKRVERGLMTFHRQHQQRHVKFLWPENQPITRKLIDYIKENHYDINTAELFIIHPFEFKSGIRNENVLVTLVTKNNLHDFLTMQYKQDERHGHEFADRKNAWYRKLFLSEGTVQVMAYFHDAPVGAVDMIQRDETIEVDHFFVIPAHRNQGVGSEIQKFVMNFAGEKSVILVADGKATPREMYQKQNYRYSGFKMEAQKIMQDTMSPQ